MLLTLIAVLSLVLAACGDDDTSAQPPDAATSSSTSHTPETQGEALKIGVLAELSGGAARWGASIQIGVDLAIKHVNAAGGVNGRDVVLVTADTGGSPIRAAAEARRLVDIEGVHAIVGPLSPGSTLDAAERLTTSARVPLVTPAMMPIATAAVANDRYLFRTTVTDGARITLAARALESKGYNSVAVVFPEHPWERELVRAFSASFGGDVILVPYDPLFWLEGGDQAGDYVGALRQAAANAEALLMMGYGDDVADLVYEAAANDIRTRFIFLGIYEQLVDRVGAEPLEGSLVVTISRDPNYASARAWEAAYSAQDSQRHRFSFAQRGYDAVITVALAAEAARSIDGTSIRDELARISGPPGRVFLANADGVQAALDAVRRGEEIDFQGSASPIDWNAAGEVTAGFMAILEYHDGVPEIVEARRFRLP